MDPADSSVSHIVVSESTSSTQNASHVSARGLVAIVGSAAEADVRGVLDALGGRALLIETDLIAKGGHISWSAEADGDGWLIVDGQRHRASSIGSVHYRPPVRLDRQNRFTEIVMAQHSDLADEYDEFGRHESAATVVGALLSSPAFWVNDPIADVRADHKLLQLAIARRTGLSVPRTLVSTDPEQLSAFWERCGGRVVTKDVASASTRLLSETHTTRPVLVDQITLVHDSVPTPVLFQETVEAELDLRVTLVGDEIFACAIHSQDGVSPFNWQFDQSVAITPFRISDDLAIKLQTLKCELGLRFGAADLRLTPEGDAVFLEMNPRGSHAFVEARTGLPIAAAVARLLTGS